MGAMVDAGGVRFRVWAPVAQRVEVELLESGAVVPLDRDDDGVWSTTMVRQAHSGSRYLFRLNGDLRRPDPYSRSQPEGVHGPSEVIDPDAFEWHDRDWRGLSILGLVIYQAHVGTATPEGTFDGLIHQLPRLKRLGVNSIQLLPLAEFPGNRNWGYDGVDLFAVTRAYGGPEGFKRFVDAAHSFELGVIVDVVYNHLGPDGNYLRDFSPDYFTDRHHTPWGEAINYARPWVRKFVVDNAQFWINEYHVDGLRLDATHAIFDDSPCHILADITVATRVHRNVVLIAETNENDVRYLESVEEGGFGLDAVYADDFHHIVRRYLAGDHEGYFARYQGTLAELARCIEKGWLHGTPARDRPAWQFLYVLQNHDQVGNRAFGERLHHQIGLEQFAAASALLLFLPFTPMLFMGQEFGASSPFQFFTDHNQELGRLVTEGRRREFKAFTEFADPATRERIPDPQAESTFLASKLRLSEAETPPGSELQEWCRSLIHLRRTDRVMIDQSRDRMSAVALTLDVLAVRRWLDDDERLLIVNFGDSVYSTEDFGASWKAVLASNEATAPTIDGLQVAARSALIAARGPQ